MKKLWQLFIIEEDQKDREDEKKKQPPRASSRLKIEQGRDIEAKVAYQYPKGKFRFPLIPDDEQVVAKRTPSHQPQTNNLRTREADSSQAEAVRYEEAESVHVEKRPQKQIRSHGPFKPSKVPSPIYGYNRPEMQQKRNLDEKAAFEMDHHQRITLRRTKEKEWAQADAVMRQTNAAAEVEEASANTADFSPFITAEKEQVKNESLIAEERGKESVLRNEEQTESMVLEDNKAKSENEQTIAEAEAGPVVVAFPLNETKAEQTRVEKAPAAIEERPAVPKEETAISEESQVVNMVVEEKEVVHEEEPSTAPPEEAPEPVTVSFALSETKAEAAEVNEEVAAAEETFAAPKAVEHVVRQEESVDRATKTVASEKIEAAPAAVNTTPGDSQPPLKKKTTPHLPFNVIMLKQDKQKLEQRSKAASLLPKKEPVMEKEEPKAQEVRAVYQFPPLELLEPPLVIEESDEWLEQQKELLNNTLINFHVGAEVVNVTQGPSVTRFEVQPEPGVKVNKITNLADDIKLNLAARDIRIEAPIPGKHTIGIEVPNPKSRPVFISEIINSPEFMKHESPLTAALGMDISGKPIVTDLRKMPHGLIAGATGSGKSVCMNTILVSLMYKAKPEELKLLLIDPKMVELAPYNEIPHLVSPVITDVKAATASLKWAVDEMERRYALFAHTGVRDIHRFNEQAEAHNQYADKLPYIVIIIDELADLMMMSPADVEEAICRIAQKARACGIHLIIATQRPSVDVITGLIKANIPTRIAFSVSSQADSRTIIDMSGAEKLLGKGDMLFLENGSSKPFRLQGTFVSDTEIDEIVAFVRKQGKPNYLFKQEELLKKAQINEEEDELFYEACEFVVAHGGASTSALQRRFKIGYNRAARLIDMMEQQGFISKSKGSKPRDVLITEEELESLQESSPLN